MEGGEEKDSLHLSGNPFMLTPSIATFILAAILIIASMATFPTTSLTAQITTGNNKSATNTTSSIIPDTTTIFQSNVDGFRVQVPDGWVVEDIDNTDPSIQQLEESVGTILLAKLCPQTETLPIIGGGYECSDEADESILIVRFADLKSRPEFAVLAYENKSITTDDLLAYYIQFFEQLNFTGFRLLENIDRVVNVTDSQTNETIATAPAKYVEMSFLDSEGELDDRDYDLFVLSNDGNTSYILTATITPSTAFSLPEELPPEHQQIFDSFELVKQ